jgi:hypothetical protein
MTLINYHCGETSKYKHVDKISRSPAEGTLFKHPTVAVCEYHVEQKVETKSPKEAEWCHESP